jgi:hypothetical protein
MTVPSPNVLLALFIVSFSLSAIFHRSSTHSGNPSNPSSPSLFGYFAADVFVPSTNDTFPSRPAAFGGSFDDSVQGELVKAWGDGLACSNLTTEEEMCNVFRGKIILVQRGLCTFAEKVRRAQYVGGIAVVVGNNVAESGLLTMFARGINP